MAKITVTRSTLEKIITLTPITEIRVNQYNNRGGQLVYVCDIPFINNAYYVQVCADGYFFSRSPTVYCTTIQECLFEHFVNGHSKGDIHVTE